MKFSSIFILSLVAYSQIHAQEAARIIEAFGDQCPLTAGGMSSPVNQAQRSIARSSGMLAAIQVDREGGSRCAGSVRLAQQQMQSIVPNTPGSDTTGGGMSGGNTGTVDGSTGGGGNGKDNPGGGNTGGGTSGGTSTGTVAGNPSYSPSTGISTEDSYQRAFEHLLSDDRVAAHEERIAQLQRELDDPNTPADRIYPIQNEIANLQQQINSIRLDQRANAQRARLSVFRHISSASDSLLNAIRSCSDSPDIVAQLTPAAMNIGSSLGIFGEATVLALDAVSSLIGGIVSYFRDQDITTAQADLERAFAPTAVRCAYLTMGQQYCHSREQRRSFLHGGQDPWRLLQYDSEGRCELRGFDLLSSNIQERGGLADQILNLSRQLTIPEGGRYSEVDIDRSLYGTMGSGGLIGRVQEINNYYTHVENSLQHDLDNTVTLMRTYGRDTEHGQQLAENARRLSSFLRDIQSVTGPTHQLMQSLNTYRSATYENFDPSVDNTPHIQALGASLRQFMDQPGGAANFENSIGQVVDFYKEGLAMRWNAQLQRTGNRYAPGLLPSPDVVRRRAQIRDRLQALTNLGQSESMRLASLGIAELSEISSERRREAMGHAVDTQLQNLQIMGRYLRPHLEENIRQVSERIRTSSTGEDSVGAARDRLLGLCESSLMLPYADLTDEIRRRCGDLIYRNEGNNNVRFSQMYTRMRTSAPFSSDIACGQFLQPDNVSRD